jgi:hypothetical protein
MQFTIDFNIKIERMGKADRQSFGLYVLHSSLHVLELHCFKFHGNRLLIASHDVNKVNKFC